MAIIQLSIHPRNWPGMNNPKKKNTAKQPKDSTKGILGKRMSNLDRRRRAREATVGSKPDLQAAFKLPGSMKK